MESLGLGGVMGKGCDQVVEVGRGGVEGGKVVEGMVFVEGRGVLMVWEDRECYCDM